MVNLTINGQLLAVEDNTTIMDAAKQNGISIPKLCYLKGINEIAACRVCVVELEGKDELLTACNNAVEEGMVIYTNSPKVRMNRKVTVELLLSQHKCLCVTCVRSGNCSLQTLAHDLNIITIPFKMENESKPWNRNFPLIRDSSKCIKCMRCVQICDKVQGLQVWEAEGTGSRATVGVSHHQNIEDANCSLCGQCITHCPVGALRERDDTDKIWEAIDNKEKIVVAQVAPAVRAAWGEYLGLSDEEATIGKILDALKRIGVDYAFDTTFSADLTIMEEGSEFLQRFTSGELKTRPMFTSCCPGWIRFIKSQYPQLVKYLSSAKSPQQMFGAVMKSYFADKLGVSPERIYTVSVMPCLAKKSEREMELYHGEFAGYDVDAVITTRELCRMIRATHVEPSALIDIESDSPMKEGSGAGVIFGATGGVMEAALRSAYFLLKGENPPVNAFTGVRTEGFNANEGLVEANFTVDDINIRTAVVSGLGNTRKLLDRIQSGEVSYDFVEVMACPGGCVGGGGQPIHDGEELAFERGKKLYHLDNISKLRFSHENPTILQLYDEYFEKPNGHKAHQLLHTDHKANK
ncbi:MAG: [FeFe] hydrogenase, group A [Eubacteriales bacterium]